jgi:hypothetical protein
MQVRCSSQVGVACHRNSTNHQNLALPRTLWSGGRSLTDGLRTEGPCRLPIMGLQIAHQGNLLFQLVERLTVHGLLASEGRIRQTASRSQARRVGTHKKLAPMAPAFTQHHKLNSRRCAHRRRVEGSGERDGSLQCGAASSTESPVAVCSQVCWRQRKLKCAEGASQSGKMVKVFLHG